MTKSTWRRAAAALAMLGVLAAVGQASAQSAAGYPNKPIRLIVSTAAGGGSDTVARLVAARLAAELKQPVVVENKPGASGSLAATAVLGAPSDGYTLLFGITTMAQLPAVTSTPLPYAAEKDFIPVSLVARSRSVLMASKQANVRTVPELVAALKANPQKYSYGSWGNGSTGHFMGELFALRTRTHPVHIPYKGAAPMMSDLLGGAISFAFPDIGSAQPHLKSERVQLLAVTGDKRLASLPQVPTLDELGIKGFDFGGWFAVFAPKGTPPAIVEMLSAKTAAAVKDREVNARLVAMDLDPVGSGSREFSAFFHDDTAKWARLAKEASIKAD
ncbi:hypothetical protein D9M68_605090 [compost metagenome]